MSTIRDVAEEANVSVATVSAVMNKDSGVNVSEKLRKRVELAIKKLNYRPNRIAQALSTKKNRMIAYVLPTIKNSFFAQMAHFIEDQAFDRGYGVYLCNTHSNSKRVNLYLENLIENQVSGVVTTLSWDIIENNFIKRILNENIPIVGIAGARMVSEIDTIITDDISGTEIAVNHLINKGRKRIGFIGVKNSKTTEKRLAGYKKAMMDSKLKYDSKYVILGSNFDIEEGNKLAGILLKKRPLVTGIFVYNDVMATGVIDRIHNLGIGIPEDISVVGYDDSVANFLRPKLTTMAVPKKEMVNIGMDILFKRINNEQLSVKHKEIIPTLFVRNST